jgi:ABC-type transport system involved in multi-copper enzyme maturation permease subunit
MNLYVVEMRRALHRRAVWMLIALALIGCVAAGIIAFVDSAGRSLAELHANGQSHPAVMRDWWISGTADGALSIASLFLLFGGLVGGASVGGAEWRAGTMTTLLTWEPRRARVQLSRCAACATLAALISLVVQVVFLSALLPATLANGSTAGLDRPWWTALLAAMARTSLLTAAAATLGSALSTLGRNTAFALVTVFAWITVAEGLIRGLRPGLARLLWAENIATVVQWASLDEVRFHPGPATALLTVAVYVAVIVGGATWAFARRDVASAS